MDTGFIVFNPVNYPHLTALFQHLGVATHESDMSFVVTVDDDAIAYGSRTLSAALARRANLLRPAFWRMLRDILLFNRTALAVTEGEPRLTVGDLLERQRLGAWFTHYYLMPMSGAIWSTPRAEMRDSPTLALARFFSNHGLLSLTGQHQWRTVRGGARSYVARMVASMRAELRLAAPVEAVSRGTEGVTVRAGGAFDRFDHAILACHSDEALGRLADADLPERRVLGRARYRENRAVLHTDAAQMPRRRACWSSWVYRASSRTSEHQASVTFWINSLQKIPADTPLYVTLNPAAPIAESRVLDEHICRNTISTPSRHRPSFPRSRAAGALGLPALGPATASMRTASPAPSTSRVVLGPPRHGRV